MFNIIEHHKFSPEKLEELTRIYSQKSIKPYKRLMTRLYTMKSDMHFDMEADVLSALDMNLMNCREDLKGFDDIDLFIFRVWSPQGRNVCRLERIKALVKFIQYSKEKHGK